MASLFTEIIQGERPAYKLFEGDDAIAILDAFPIRYGHTLVIPKREVADWFELDAASYAAVWDLAKQTAVAMKKSIACKKIGVAVMGFEVPHAHIHLVPLDAESDLNFSRKKRFTAAEFLAVQAKIKAGF